MWYLLHWPYRYMIFHKNKFSLKAWFNRLRVPNSIVFSFLRHECAFKDVKAESVTLTLGFFQSFPNQQAPHQIINK